MAKSEQPARKEGVYRGYLIRYNPLRGETWVEKGGYLMSYAKDYEDAKAQIDWIIDGESKS